MSSDTATASSCRTNNGRRDKPGLDPLGPDQQLGEEFFKELLGAEEDDGLDLTFLDPLPPDGSAPSDHITAEDNAALQQLLDWTGSQPFHSEVCLACVLCEGRRRQGRTAGCKRAVSAKLESRWHSKYCSAALHRVSRACVAECVSSLPLSKARAQGRSGS